jgi:hypothetical protein
MSTGYCPLGQIAVADLLDGRLLAYGIKEHRNPDGQLCLFDSMNYVHVHAGDEGQVGGFSRYGGNNASYILGCISEAFGVRIVSEYEPEYWGFATQEAWDAAMAAMAREDDDRHYADVIRYVKGEPNDIHPGTNGEADAKRAKELIAAEPGLIEPAMREALMAHTAMAAAAPASSRSTQRPWVNGSRERQIRTGRETRRIDERTPAPMFAR